MVSRQQEFEARSKSFAQQADILAAKVKELSLYRVVAFVLALGIMVYLANERHAWGVFFTLVIFLPLFGILVNRHNKAKKKLAVLRSLVKINQDEVSRLNNELQHFDGGDDFQEEHHPYTSDLDIFGRFSIFKLVNRANTPAGKSRLAAWLSNPAEPEEIQRRQHAVRELAALVDWRQSFDAMGRINLQGESKVKVSMEKLLQLPRPVSSLFKTLAIVSVVASLVIYALVLLSVVTWHWVGLAVVFNGMFLAGLMKAMQEEYVQLESLAKRLALYTDLFESIEGENFEGEWLSRQRNKLLDAGEPASALFRSLLGIVSQFDNRSNMLYQVFNGLFILDYWLMQMVHRWFVKNHERVPAWLDAVTEMEALAGLAAFAHANPSYAFPAVTQDDFHITADDLGHPLIPAGKRIVNNFQLKGKGLLLITGSNMSGKSTFLRTVGVNVALALCGGPVCASKMEASTMEVFTSMRTHDDLEESVSSFYAELRRIRQLLDLLESGRPVLYMLDEVLKGTNSEDRHKGTEALVNQLLKNHAAGFISTHDLSLSKLGDTNPHVTNYSFNSRIEGNQLLFDYRLTPGPCSGFNASLLMKNIGIEIIP